MKQTKRPKPQPQARTLAVRLTDKPDDQDVLRRAMACISKRGLKTASPYLRQLIVEDADRQGVE